MPGGRSWPYWLSIDHQNKIRNLWKAGKVTQMIPCHWIGEDEHGNLRGISWIYTENYKGIYIDTGMREHNFHAVCCSDLLSQIAIFELYEKLEQVLNGKRKAIDSERIEAQIKKYESSFSRRYIASCGISMNG